jgi:hypothetical protein
MKYIDYRVVLEDGVDNDPAAMEGLQAAIGTLESVSSVSTIGYGGEDDPS